MTTGFVGAEHEFHRKEYALGWADKFVPTPERTRLFDLIFTQVRDAVPEDGNVVELGIGPGYLADYLLERMPRIRYCGIDSSLPMLEIAQARLQRHSPRVVYARADLVEEGWEAAVPKPLHAVVSTWSLHDLGSPKAVETVYRRSHRALDAGGLLLNGDFIKPAGAVQEFEGGRFCVTQHLQLLGAAGFSDARCLATFEEETENPTPAQNYVCIRAAK